MRRPYTDPAKHGRIFEGKKRTVLLPRFRIIAEEELLNKAIDTDALVAGIDDISGDVSRWHYVEIAPGIWIPRSAYYSSRYVRF
jgi:hypothetical protein